MSTKWIIWYAIFLHIIQGSLLIVDDSAGWVTSTRTLVKLVSAWHHRVFDALEIPIYSPDNVTKTGILMVVVALFAGYELLKFKTPTINGIFFL